MQSDAKTLISPAGTPSTIGTDNWMLQTWRLARWNLFMVRRRMMSKVLAGILLLGFLLVTAFNVFSYLLISTATPGESCPPGATSCISPSPQQVQAARDAALAQLLPGLTLPTSLGPTAGYMSFMGAIVLCIMAGTLIGSEYGFSTLRLVLSRGMSRAQVLTAQIVALALLALGVVGGMFLLGALVGLLVGPALGGSLTLPDANGWGEIVIYGLTLAFSLFAFMLIALFMATLGRSTAAGIGLSLGYILFESIASGILRPVGELITGDWGQRLEHIPDWFLGNNTSALVSVVGRHPIQFVGGAASSISTPQALVVSLIYCALLIGVSFVLLQARDVAD